MLYWIDSTNPLLLTSVISQAFNLSFKLSTSQTPVKTTDRFRLERCASAGGFGTVTDTGYGVSYLVISDDLSKFYH